MIRLATSNTPEEAAWAAFDEAALRVQRVYQSDLPTDRALRRQVTMEAARLWNEWRKLFLDDGPGEAA